MKSSVLDYTQSVLLKFGGIIGEVWRFASIPSLGREDRQCGMAEQRIRNYRAFWPFYVRQHRRPATRRLHFIGTSGALALVALAAALPQPWLYPAALVCGYFFAWTGHVFVEKNRPATFTYPLFSLIGDFHMYALMWLARMDNETARCVGDAAPPPLANKSGGG
jgi:hypothetical protein